MKKNLSNNKIIIIAVIVVLIVSILLFTNNKTIKCTGTSKQTGYTYDTEYIIKASGNKVKTITIKETITSKKATILDKFEKQYKEQYEYDKKTYGGYQYTINNKDGKLEVNVDIDYKKMDMEKFIKNNATMKQYTKKNKLTLKGAKKLYESTGAVCK